jgi:protein-arginine kinase activator protein McsA
MQKKCYGVLADKKDDIESLFFPIVASSVASLEQEFKYQQSKSSPTKAEVAKAPVSGEKTLSDLQGELKDAEAKEEYERASEIRDEIERRFPNK